MTASDESPRTGRPSAPRQGVVAWIRAAIAYCAVPARLRRTTTIAIAVGTILTVINQGDVIFGGDATSATGVKTGLNFLVPFVVSNLGLLSGRGGASPDDFA